MSIETAIPQRETKQCNECGAAVTRYPSQMVAFKYCSAACKAKGIIKNQNTGFGKAENRKNWALEKHPNWKGGRQRRGDGYIRIAVGGGKRVMEARLVMEKELGRKLTSNEHIRHIDGDASNSAVSNLEIWKKERKKTDRTRSEISRANNRKGKVYERHVAEYLTKITGVPYRRTPASGALSGLKFDVMKIGQQPSILDGVGVEAKDWAKITSSTILDWIKQCENAASDMNYRKWVIMFDWQGSDYFILNERYFTDLVESQRALNDLSTQDPQAA